MNPDHARFAEWDAAYVVGALSPADRRLFEEHLAECAHCERAIAEIAAVGGLLARVERDRAESLLDGGSGGPDPSRRGELARIAVARHRRRRAWWLGGLAAAAAVAIAITLAFAVSPALTPTEGTTVAMQATADVPLEATAQLQTVSWGTRIELECSYAASAAGVGYERAYALFVTAGDGAAREVSSWRAGPGSTVNLETATAFGADEITSLEIRSVDTGEVLMRADTR